MDIYNISISAIGIYSLVYNVTNPMKKLLLIALLIVGCDNSTEEEDCAGVVGLAISQF